ncbi:beta-N-acetylhexosaminidase [Sphingobacterium griseoflavum]|uniref:beta-N-acetylhexosaminidase n=1 Tax=Sphingobacterium griseoflavum TaxID=1474952 RepID=A0ABQ3HYM0_9SPHI|nr:family 20 glycosylhydrolase [Sphingobacterium griseoflavum]GHE37162.1 beta-N-acetylhexosaminidase [Sphingobacterium griseoflavum]
MKIKPLFLMTLATVGFASLSFCSYAQVANSPIALYWRKTASYNGKDSLNLDLVLKNTSAQVVDLSNADLWFNAIFPIEERQTTNYTLSDENGNLFRVRFADAAQIQPQDSLQITYASKYPILNVSNIPNGFYLQDRSNPDIVSPLSLSVTAIQPDDSQQAAYWARLYTKNETRQLSTARKQVLPTPKKMNERQGKLVLEGTISYWIDPAFEVERNNLQGFANAFEQLTFTGSEADKAQIRVKQVAGYSDEAYSLRIQKDGIRIEASEGAGVFYALQSLRSLLSPAAFQGSKVTLPLVDIDDEPRYAYRGFMMDIARNFKEKSTILKYIDLLSRYKINTFHFHFIDDEGWRIEIAALPELTAVGANRTAMFASGQSIQPSYGSGASSSPHNFLTREDFIDILRYAKQRHITVVPEIETPGHARASIKAMEARYHAYLAKGDKKEAERYLLHDLEDRSVYSSAQYWNDNVMNVALPSVYAFISVVLDEFKSMYADAGLTLQKVSLGGDEVPSGAWEKSPKIKQLMDSLGMASVYEVWPYYIDKINHLCQNKGLQLAGWEEMGMVNKGNGMEVNQELASANIQLDVWNNLIGAGQEDLAYRLANAGYPTVYISANNNYFDMAWDTNFEEPGLKWASYADLYQSYTFLPENFFASIQHSINGSKFEEGHFRGKKRLNEKGRSHLLGIKGGLWAETVVTGERLDYMVFPRLFSLAERAWAPRKRYEDDAKFDIHAFNKDYSEFLNKVSEVELPKIAGLVKFRLPAVGVKEMDGKLHANVEYPTFKIYYTTDGTKPNLGSQMYTEPLVLQAGQVYSFVVLDAEGRAGTVSVIRK